MITRKSIRLKGHDYTAPASYFVTIETQNGNPLFGEIVDGTMKLNKYGEIVFDEWVKTSKIRPSVFLDDFVIMPNHLHGIIVIREYVRATRRVARTNTPGVVSDSLGAIIGQFKSVVSKRIRHLSKMPNRHIWKRNYYDRIVRSDALEDIRKYIRNNPSQLPFDASLPRL